jgi:putative ATPase
MRVQILYMGQTHLLDTATDDALALVNAPLAERMRPRSLDEVVGQPQLTANDSSLRRGLGQGQLSSAVLWGPPGTGKTTIALCLAREVDAVFEQLNAVVDGIKELRAIIERASARRAKGERTLLFIDEIARWNKSQQDALLPLVEKGIVILVGATTAHPSYNLNSALLSRLRVHTLRPLGEVDLLALADKALTDVKRGVGIPIDDTERESYSLSKEASAHLLLLAEGDARKMLGIIEEVARSKSGGVIEVADVEAAAGARVLAYDSVDEHYATVSAFIKSIRHSDVDAALYYLARMEAGGEDPVFIARRLMISASEEVGTAASGALAVAVAGAEAVARVGPPECWLNLAHVTAYLARSPKSWAAYQGLQAARAAVAERPHYPIPAQMRNPANALARAAGHGRDYVHASKVGGTEIECLPPELRNWRAYRPSGNGQDQ